ncbi:MAG: hypothetical protein ACC652_02415, partial [Acidimicrobiales bacterium]
MLNTPGENEQQTAAWRTLPRSVRTIEAAAVAGLVFSALFTIASVLLLRSPVPDSDWASRSDWYLSSSNQQS